MEHVLQHSMKKTLPAIIFACILLIVFCCFFSAPAAEAAQSDSNLLADLRSPLHIEPAREQEQKEEPGIAGDEKLYSKVLSSTHKIQLSLNEHLKLFFNLQPTIREYYEKLNTDKNCTMLGIDIFF